MPKGVFKLQEDRKIVISIGGGSARILLDNIGENMKRESVVLRKTVF